MYLAGGGGQVLRSVSWDINHPFCMQWITSVHVCNSFSLKVMKYWVSSLHLCNFRDTYNFSPVLYFGLGFLSINLQLAQAFILELFKNLFFKFVRWGIKKNYKSIFCLNKKFQVLNQVDFRRFFFLNFKKVYKGKILQFYFFKASLPSYHCPPPPLLLFLA